MGLNRCTALTSPFVHQKIWEGYPFIIIISLFIIAPLAMGYKYLFGHCLPDFLKPQCASIVAECYLIITVINVPLLIFTLVATVVGVFVSKKQNSFHSDVRKIEARLVWQAISSSIFLILYYLSNYLGGVLYDQDPEVGAEMYTASMVFYMMHNCFPIVILFIVCTNFRKQFAVFYGLQRTDSSSKINISTMISFQIKK
ncbi:hypothetical protein FO519_006164 [Halicephalobus sp. NKZ332]|nr:hypothetical protein FO519_006164 [Halicephalobus sp. NKZ332]